MTATSSSKTLTEHIRQALTQAGGTLSFADFMELALYQPDTGYYSQISEIGRAGDFTTAPEISPLFARCIARQCAELFKQLPKQILELGAGTGRLAVDLLLALDKEGLAPNQYYIYEISHALRSKQQTLLRTHCPHLYERIHWLDALPTDFAGIVLANEVLDALPVHCFCINDTIKERSITWHNGEFAWQLTEPSETLRTAVSALNNQLSLPNHYESEINLRLNNFITELAQGIKQGVILLIDYGYGEREYYHPERRHGTLTCFYQHQKNNDPLQHIGLQDITAHVDFTRVINIAANTGCTLLGYTSQAAFLLACGLMDIAATEETTLSTADQVHLHHTIKLLTFPTEMGERIKVMAIGKNMFPETTLLGFTLQDRRRDL